MPQGVRPSWRSSRIGDRDMVTPIEEEAAAIVAEKFGHYFHCWETDSEHYTRVPCRDLAQIVYRLEDGTRRGYCAGHMAKGIALAARHGWVHE